MNVRIRRRGADLRIEGEPQPVRQARDLLRTLYAQADQALSAQTVHLAILESKSGAAPKAKPAVRETRAVPALPAKEPVTALHTRRPEVMARTPNQARYLQHILTKDLTFGIGPAGTGKTFLAVACAVDALERSAVQRIILTRPAVEAGERLGFLPGDLSQKVDPYLRPLYDALYDLMGFERVTKAFERGAIEIAPLAFMRGRTLNHAFVILDEAQNTTPEQMKMFLTRIGFGTRAVVNGDLTQVDLPRGARSGLADALGVLQDVAGIAITRFGPADVVRHPLVARIVDAYEAAARQEAAPAPAPERPPASFQEPRRPARGGRI